MPWDKVSSTKEASSCWGRIVGVIFANIHQCVYLLSNQFVLLCVWFFQYISNLYKMKPYTILCRKEMWGVLEIIIQMAPLLSFPSTALAFRFIENIKGVTACNYFVKNPPRTSEYVSWTQVTWQSLPSNPSRCLWMFIFLSSLVCCYRKKNQKIIFWT